jgi:hypothetical protein
MRGEGWTRRGFSLLWGPEALARIATPAGVRSLRQLFDLAGHWPDVLPAAHGDGLVVAGLQGCLDALSPEDGVAWLEGDLKEVVLDFQEHYQGGAALILWLPSGRRRIQMAAATEHYTWRCAAPHGGTTLDLGRCLWGGAEADVARILVSEEAHPDVDGAAWVGLHHPRIS